MHLLSEQTRLARFRLRTRRAGLATVAARDGRDSAAYRHAAAQVAEARRALPWWLRLTT